MEETEEQLAKLIPKEFFMALAQAKENGELGIILVLSDEMVARIKRDEVAMISMEDGGTIIMITQASLDKIYVDGKKESQAAV